MARIISLPRLLKILSVLTVIILCAAVVHLRLLEGSKYRQTSSKSQADSTLDKAIKRRSGEAARSTGHGNLSNGTRPIATQAVSEGRRNETSLVAPTASKQNNTANYNLTSKNDASKVDRNMPEAKKSKKTNAKLPPESEFKRFRHDDSYEKYMQCPTNPRKRLAGSKIFKDRYIPDVPVLMWNESVTADEYERLSQFWGCYGWQHMSFEGVKETLKHLNTPGHRYMFDAGLLLKDKTGNNTGCIRCAVIGGGGILNGSRKGKEIDDHDYVFRVNKAITIGHEADVGKKTTHYAFTMTTLRNSLLGGRKYGFKTAPHDKNTHYLVLPCEKSDYFLVENRATGKSQNDFKAKDPKHRGVPNFGKTVKAEDFKMLHPDFQRYMEFFWINSRRRFQHVNRPSTGALMLIAAIHTCDEVSAYGFGVNFRKYTTHYYDKKYTKFVYYANHDFNQELKLWNDLDKEGIIKLYKG